MVDKTVLVTGSAGFIGRNLVKYLQSIGCNVIEYDLRYGQDILDFDKLNAIFETYPIDEVYHLAAQAFVGPGEANPYLDLDINGKGMLNVLRCVEKYEVPLVYTSSGSVYGLTDSFPHAEDAKLRPTANYGITKHLGELYIQKWVVMTGIDAKAVRFSSVYGPDRGKMGPVNIFLELALEGKPLTVYGDGSQTRDIVHISDATNGVVHVLRHGKAGEIYNVGIGVEHSVSEVAEIVAEITDVPLTYVKGHDFSPFDVKRSYYNIEKIKGIGWNPTISLPVGILRTYKEIKRMRGL